MRCIIYISVFLAAMLVAKFTNLPHACSQANTIAHPPTKSCVSAIRPNLQALRLSTTISYRQKHQPL
jgi:hypothetical protein